VNLRPTAAAAQSSLAAAAAAARPFKMHSLYPGVVEVAADSNAVYRPRTRPKLQDEAASFDGTIVERSDNDSIVAGPRVSWMKSEMNVFGVPWDDAVTLLGIIPFALRI
jgi:hypothetical protein